MRRIAKLLWIATTPLALTILLAVPARSQEHAEAVPGEEIAGEHEHEPAATSPITNMWHFFAKDEAPPFSAALVNFGVLIFLLGKYAAPSFARFTRERHLEIAKALEDASALRDAARKKLEEYERRLAGLKGEIARLVGDIRAEAEADKQRILAEAAERARSLERDAEQQIVGELKRATRMLEREAAMAAVALAEKLLKEKTSDADQRTLAEGFVKNLEAQTAKSIPASGG